MKSETNIDSRITKMRKTIALVGGGYKPFTKGHYMVVQHASDIADEAHLFVSTADRSRPGQLPVFWTGQMEEIWNRFLEKAMPSNVSVHYVRNPNTAIFQFLENADTNESDHNSYIILGGGDDVPKYFPEKNLRKYLPRLWGNEQLDTKTFERTEDGVDDVSSVSGTKMRQAVVNGDVIEFTKGLPKPVQRHGQEIFDILATSVGQIKEKKKKRKKSK